MLIVEIQNDGKNKKHPAFGSYDYTVKVNRRVIATGHIDDQPRDKPPRRKGIR